MIVESEHTLAQSITSLKLANGAQTPSNFQLEFRLLKGIYKSDAEKEKDTIISSTLAASPIYNWRSFTLDDSKFKQLVSRVMVGSIEIRDGELLDLHGINSKELQVHFYSVKDFGGLPHEISTNDDEAIGSYQWELPCGEFDDLWENLIYDDNIKNELLSYVSSIIRLSQKGANTNILSMNRLVLLYGPPGTGKTTLCKALAQRLAIQLGHTYKRSMFIEINSHSLFSKWFSESGKLVLKMFNQIEEMAEDSKTFVCVLIDEVESLTMGRNSALQKHEPSDSVRAVNAVLTQIDKIRRFKNVLVLTTSNITDALDTAFIDRTDICRFIGNPTTHAIYLMLFDAITELQRIGILDGEESFKESISRINSNEPNMPSNRLWELANECKEGEMTGRTIRKLPISAYSKHSTEAPLSVEKFLEHLKNAIDDKRNCTFQQNWK